MARKYTKNFFVSIVLLTLFAVYSFAQQSRVAVINSEKTLQYSEEGKKAIAQLVEKEKKINVELGKIDEQILTLETRLNRQKLTLTFETQQKLALDLDNLRIKRKRVEEDSIKEFQQLKFELYSKIRKEVLPIIDSVAKEKEFSLVLDLSTSGVLYFEPAFDITDEVIKKYNASKAKTE